jgi:iron-sulfur cluster insertion protein
MSDNNNNPAPLLNFTLAAALKVKSLIDEEGNPNLHLRVYITGGGCSGFQYGFTFDDMINNDDIVIERQLRAKNNANNANNANIADEEDENDSGNSGAGSLSLGIVKLLVDPMSYTYLQGAEIDYREDAAGAQFVIKNPNAKTTCGCGSSFSA